MYNSKYIKYKLVWKIFYSTLQILVYFTRGSKTPMSVKSPGYNYLKSWWLVTCGKQIAILEKIRSNFKNVLISYMTQENGKLDNLNK